MLVSKYVIYVIVFRLRTIVFYKTREYYYRQFVFPRVGKKYREKYVTICVDEYQS